MKGAGEWFEKGLGFLPFLGGGGWSTLDVFQNKMNVGLTGVFFLARGGSWVSFCFKFPAPDFNLKSKDLRENSHQVLFFGMIFFWKTKIRKPFWDFEPEPKE